MVGSGRLIGRYLRAVTKKCQRVTWEAKGPFLSSQLSKRHLLQHNSGFVLPGRNSMELGAWDTRQYMSGKQGKNNLLACSLRDAWMDAELAHKPS